MKKTTRAASTAAQTPQTPNNDDKGGDGEKAGERDKKNGGKADKSVNPEVKIRYGCAGGTKTCNQELSDEDKSIMCDGCERWFHYQCQNLSLEAFQALSGSDLVYLCLECRPNMKNLLKRGIQLECRIMEAEKKIMAAINRISLGEDTNTKLEEKFTSMETTVMKEMNKHQVNVKTSLEKSFAEIIKQQTRVESTVKEQNQAVQEMPKFSKVLKNSAEQIKKIVETKEKEGREANLILHNIPESKSTENEKRKKYDTESFYNIATALYGNTTGLEVEQIFRLGKKPDSTEPGVVPKPRLTLVKLKSKESVDLMIKRRTQLKDVGFPNVYITRDLAPEERMRQRELREELKQKGRDSHMIFRGQVVPRASHDH